MGAGCSSKEPDDDIPGDAPVTIPHAFGETTVPLPPERVVSAGLTGGDYLLAVGVVPVAVTNWFGDQPSAVWPWAQPKLGDAKPVVLDLDNGLQIDRIAGLRPDLILAADAGLDAETYETLSTIAPTVAQSGGDAFFEPWKTHAEAVGRAVFRAEQMSSLVDDVEQRFSDVAHANPAFTDKRVLLLEGRLQHGAAVAMTGSSTEFLTTMGLAAAEGIDASTARQRAVIPADELTVLVGADVLIWMTEGDDEAALLATPEIAALQHRSVFTGTEQAAAIAFASPLSYRLVAEQLPPLIAAILG